MNDPDDVKAKLPKRAMGRLEKLRKPFLSMDPSEQRELITYIRADRQRSKVPAKKPKKPKAAAAPVPPAPRQEESTPPAAETVPIADGSENSTPMSGGTSEGDTDDRARCWRMSRRGNSYIDNFQGCHVVVWRVLGGWRFHIVHKATGVTWQSDTTLADEDEARGAALDKLSKRLPEFLQRLAAERSRG